MPGINRVTLIGNLGQDPEVRYMPNGNAVANLSLATSEKWKDKEGQKQERTEWHRVSVFGKLAEIIQKYCHKGDTLYLEGKLRTRSYEKDGIKRYTTEVIIDFDGKMEMLGGKRGENAPRNPQEPQRDFQARSVEGQSGPVDFDDDVPF